MSRSVWRSSFSALRQFVRKRESVERCDLCAIELPVSHDHLIEPTTLSLVCACRSCTVLFEPGRYAEDTRRRFRRIPRGAGFFESLALSDEAWSGLNVPVDLVFFFESSAKGRIVAMYPSPAGVMESGLDPEAWRNAVLEVPALGRLAPDTEAFLVHRIGRARDHFIVPIDHAFRLAGLMRRHWRGLAGGRKVWDEIAGFVGTLRGRALPLEGA